MQRNTFTSVALACAFVAGAVSAAAGQTRPQPAGQGRTQPAGQNRTSDRTAPAPAAAAAAVVVPPGYVIGLEDVIGVVFWRDETMSGDVVVRPDGRISVPLLNDIEAVGLTPEQLRGKVVELAKKFIEEPNVTVVVRQINSRKVFLTGQVLRGGSFPLSGPMTVLQVIALGGGLAEFAKGEEITVVRPGQKDPFKFNYEEVRRGKNLQQNIELKPGDTIIVP